MKRALNKIFAIILGAFMLAGGVIFSACAKNEVSNIVVTSDVEINDNTITMDLNEANKIVLNARLDGKKQEQISCGTNDNNKLSIKRLSYQNGVTSFEITPLEEGSPQITFTASGATDSTIKFNFYSDILGLEQIQDPNPDQNVTQYVVKSTSTQTKVNQLDINKFLTFPNSRQLSRKVIEWSVVTENPFLTLNGNEFIVEKDYPFDTVTLRATPTYKPELAKDISLKVVDEPKVSAKISYKKDQLVTDVLDLTAPMELVKKSGTDRSVLYIRLEYPSSDSLIFEQLVDGKNADLSEDISITAEGNPLTVSGTTSQLFKIEMLTNADCDENHIFKIDFVAKYAATNEKGEVIGEKYAGLETKAASFEIKFIDVIDKISLSSDGTPFSEGDTLRVYNNYERTSTSAVAGMPLKIDIASGTKIKNAQFVMELLLPSSVNAEDESLNLNNFLKILLNSESGNIGFTRFETEDGRVGFRSEPIYTQNEISSLANMIYISASGNYQTNAGEAIDFTITSVDEQTVKRSVKIECYSAPNEDFSLGLEQDETYYFATYQGNPDLAITLDGSELGSATEDDVEIVPTLPNSDLQVQDFRISGGRISFSIHNLKVLKRGNLELAIRHKNGYQSKFAIIITAFRPMFEAGVEVDRSQSGSLSMAYAEQGFTQNGSIYSYDNAYITLDSMQMQIGTPIKLVFNSDAGKYDSTIFSCLNPRADWKEALQVSGEYDITLIAQFIQSLIDSREDVKYLTDGLLSISNNFNGYMLSSFTGYDIHHNEITYYRITYINVYTAPTKIISSQAPGLSLTAKDSLSPEDSYLSTASVKLRYRADGKNLSYFTYPSTNKDIYDIKIVTSQDRIADLAGGQSNGYFHIEKFACSPTEVSFEICADSTGSAHLWAGTIIFTYTLYGIDYSHSIELLIENATRVTNVEWRNRPANDTVYFDFNGADTSYTIRTYLTPIDAKNTKLFYGDSGISAFVPDVGTSASLIDISQLGVISFDRTKNASGGSGYVYVFPQDAIRAIGANERQIIYYTSASERREVALKDISKYYDDIIKGYFYAFDETTGQRVQISYAQVMLKIRIIVADGSSEELAQRIYSADQLKNINPDLHYVLMNSLTLEDWSSLPTLNGSLRGYSENTTLTFESSSPLFDSIGAKGKVKNLTLRGVVSGGGFIANTNSGEIDNVKVVNYFDGDKLVRSGVTSSSENAGAIVGENNGTISNVTIEGVDVSATTYAGGIAGINNGTITTSKVEFYIYGETEGETKTQISNTISAQNVGGIAGKLGSNGRIEKSYAYNYSTVNILSGTNAGAFAGESESGATISTSFALVNADKAVGSGDVNTSDVYYSTEEVEGEQTNPQNWVKAGDNGFLEYVRAGKPYLKDLYQAEAITSGDFAKITIQSYKDSASNKQKSVAANAGASGIIFLRAVSGSEGLTDSERASLNALNTMSLSELLGESAKNVVASSNNSSILEVVGNQIIVKKTGGVTLKISSKQNYELTQSYNIQVSYVASDFAIKIDGQSISGFSQKENTSKKLNFSYESEVYLANNASPFKLILPKFTISGSLDEKVTDADAKKSYASLSISGIESANLHLANGITEFLGDNKNPFSVTFKMVLGESIDASFITAIQDFSTKQISVTAFEGTNEIQLFTNSIELEPAFSTQTKITLLTDDKNDDIGLSVIKKIGESSVELSLPSETNKFANSLTFSFEGQNILSIIKQSPTGSSFDDQKDYTLTISIDENYKSKIAADEEYILEIISKSGDDSLKKSIPLILKSQEINYVDIANYRAGTPNYSGTQITFPRTNELISVLAPGKASIMEVVVDPYFAYYEYFTITYQVLGNKAASLGITKLNIGENANYTIDNSASSRAIPGGLRVARNDDASFEQKGRYAFRIYAGTNFDSNTQFSVNVAFYNANGAQIGQTKSFTLLVSVLQTAELMINDDTYGILAKGGTAELSIILDESQTLESLVVGANNGVSIMDSAKPNEDMGDGKIKIYKTLYADIDASVDGEGHNGRFNVQATVVRNINGERETKTSYVAVTLIDILPNAATIDNAEHNDTLGMDEFTAFNGIERDLNLSYTFSPISYPAVSGSDRQAAVKNLEDKRVLFNRYHYLYDEQSGFAINYKNGAPERIIDRMYWGQGSNRQSINWSLEDDGSYVANSSDIRLKYVEYEAGDYVIGSLAVLGLRITSTITYITIEDRLYLSSASSWKGTISTSFAISVVDTTSEDVPEPITNADEFTNACENGQGHHYILLNDITLVDYTPRPANFASLDGNGYTVHITSFNKSTSGNVSLALFSTISTDSLVKNLKVNLYNGGNLEIDTAGNTNMQIDVAGFAITNDGIITNCEVVAYRNSDAPQTNSKPGLRVQLMQRSSPIYSLGDRIQSRVAGFVINNNGSITNSKVGGNEIIVIGSPDETSISGERYNYTTETLPTFELYGLGRMAGFVLSNSASGHISSSGASNIQITNATIISTDELNTSTSGFVGTNNGIISTSYVEGKEGGFSVYHNQGSSIKSQGRVAGFVDVNDGENTDTSVDPDIGAGTDTEPNRKLGIIQDCYTNILLDTQSKTSAGFVYENSGKISTSYSASYVGKDSLLRLSFSGVSGDSTSLNTGTISNSYYLISDKQETDEDMQQAIPDGAVIIDASEIENRNSYYGFVFSTSNTSSDGVWVIEGGKGVKLVAENEKTISHRHKVDLNDNEYYFPYSTLIDNTTSALPIDTSYGSSINKILISSAEDLIEAVGESDSVYVSSYYDDNNVWGAYRFVADVNLETKNNENVLINAKISSVDKIFKGQIDGNGFTIKNLSLGTTSGRGTITTAAGLFRELQNAQIKNLNIEVNNVTFETFNVVGSLAGISRDSTVIKVEVTQNNPSSSSAGGSTTLTNGRGVFGKNITGGIIGAAFGDNKFSALKVNNIVVQSAYWEETSSDERYANFNYPKGGKADAIRQNAAKHDDTALFGNGDSSLAKVSFAGGVIGYLDNHKNNQLNQKSFVYSENMSTQDYEIRQIEVAGAIEVKGEVVGGAFGYTGYNTRMQDVSVKISNRNRPYAKILSYNTYAGGIVGLANGQFNQTYAEHDAAIQSAIESDDALRYFNSTTASSERERGILDLFKFTGQDKSEYKYNAPYAGGIFGAVNSASLQVGYSKLNVINTQDGANPTSTYAGGIVGKVLSNQTFEITNPYNQNRESVNLYLNEVYSMGDVYAGTAFAGIVGQMENDTEVSSEKKISSVIALSSVNAVNHYGVHTNRYQDNTAYAIVNQDLGDKATFEAGESPRVKIILSDTAIDAKKGDGDGSIANKSFGYMNSYMISNTQTLTVNLYPNYEDDLNDDKIFIITPVTSFSSVGAGYKATNSAFLNSLAWSSDHWAHPINQLYPSINFVNVLSYVYLDQHNIDFVMKRLSNSSIEVRVRGEQEPNSKTYGHVDLREWLNEEGHKIENFSGRFVGGSDNTWGEGFGPVSSNYTANAVYPGIIINKSLIESASSGALITYLNVFVDGNDFGIMPGNAAWTADETMSADKGGLLFENDILDCDINGVRLYLATPVQLTANAEGNAGLIAPKAERTSIQNTRILFSGKATSAGYEGTENVQDKAYPLIVKPFSPINDVSSTGDNLLNFGLIVGEANQSGTTQMLRLQNNAIWHCYEDDSSALADIEVGGKTGLTLNAGMLIGAIKSGEDIAYSDIYANMLPAQNLNETGTIHTAIKVYGDVLNANVGGYYGNISAQANVALQYNNSSADAEGVTQLNLPLNVTGEAMYGGLVGKANIGQFNFVGSSDLPIIRFDFDTKNQGGSGDEALSVNSTSAGLLFGYFEGDANIDLGGGIFNGEFVTHSYADTKSNVAFTGATNFGGFVGKNNGNLTIGNINLHLQTYSSSGNTLDDKVDPINDFILNVANPFTNVSELHFGGFVGQNDKSLTVQAGAKYGVVKEGAETGKSQVVAFDVATLYAGDIVGVQGGSGSIMVTSFETNSTNYFAATTLDCGGIIGHVDDGATLAINAESQGSILVMSNTFIDSATVSAGGAVGNIEEGKINQVENSAAISNLVFGGAFKFQGENMDSSTHVVGGLIGKIGKLDQNVTFDGNILYGDAIYNFTSDISLSSYTFGGVIGEAAAEEGKTESKSIILSNNVIAFTNNNSIYSENYLTDALVGNGTVVTATQLVATETKMTNYYSSNLTLAVSDQAIDIGAYTVYTANAKGYGESEGSTTLKAKIPSELINASANGVKLNPVENGEVSEATTTHGIIYFTSTYPEAVVNKGESAIPFAYIGDFQSGKTESLSLEIGEHSFVSGLVVASERIDTKDEDFKTPQIIGGIVDKLSGGTIYACRADGDLSIGGNEQVTIGGIVGSMNGGRIAECFNNANITYRAKADGTAAGIATIAAGHSMPNFIDATYSMGDVKSYISANLYSFASGDAKTYIRNSQTASWVSLKDHTKATASGTTGVFGSANIVSDVYQDLAAIELNSSDEIHKNKDVLSSGEVKALADVAQFSDTTIATASKGWKKVGGFNYGYPYRNFSAFELSSLEGSVYLVPNATKLNQITSDKNYKLIRDVDLSAANISVSDKNVSAFDGDYHIISGVTKTLFSSVTTLFNLKVIAKETDIISGSAVVANQVASAENVSASGVLSGSGANIGGLFATSSGEVKNCKNYVKIDVTESATYVGGVVGLASGKLTGCVNYSPINAESTSYVGGVVGSTSAAVEQCGNENTVFNGYTNTTSTSKEYNAGGVVGATTADVTNCYNTSMVKAGNKNNTSLSTASGIVASTTASVSDCVNEGFIEALGTNPGNPTINVTNTDGKVDVTYSYGNTKSNVAAYQISEKGSGNKRGSVYNNGDFGPQTLISYDDKEISANSEQFYIEGGANGSGIGITISDVTPEDLIVAEVDRLGGPRSFYFKRKRTITYGSTEITKDQTYYSKLENVDTPYEALANQEQTKTQSAGTAIDSCYYSPDSEENPYTVITISDKAYSFIRNLEGFRVSLDGSYVSSVITLSVATKLSIGGNEFTISELNGEGYSFRATSTSPNVSLGTPYLQGDYLQIPVRYKKTDAEEEEETITKTIEYTLSASKRSEYVEYTLNASRLFKDDGKLKITLSNNDMNGNEMLVGQRFTITINEIDYVFVAEAKVDGWQTLVLYNGDAEATGEYVTNAFAALKDQEITLNLNQGKADETTEIFTDYNFGNFADEEGNLITHDGEDISYLTQMVRLNSYSSDEITESKPIDGNAHIELEYTFSGNYSGDDKIYDLTKVLLVATKYDGVYQVGNEVFYIHRGETIDVSSSFTFLEDGVIYTYKIDTQTEPYQRTYFNYNGKTYVAQSLDYHDMIDSILGDSCFKYIENQNELSSAAIHGAIGYQSKNFDPEFRIDNYSDDTKFEEIEGKRGEPIRIDGQESAKLERSDGRKYKFKTHQEEIIKDIELDLKHVYLTYAQHPVLPVTVSAGQEYDEDYYDPSDDDGDKWDILYTIASEETLSITAKTYAYPLVEKTDNIHVFPNTIPISSYLYSPALYTRKMNLCNWNVINGEEKTKATLIEITEATVYNNEDYVDGTYLRFVISANGNTYYIDFLEKGRVTDNVDVLDYLYCDLPPVHVASIGSANDVSFEYTSDMARDIQKLDSALQENCLSLMPIEGGDVIQGKNGLIELPDGTKYYYILDMSGNYMLFDENKKFVAGFVGNIAAKTITLNGVEYFGSVTQEDSSEKDSLNVQFEEFGDGTKFTATKTDSGGFGFNQVVSVTYELTEEQRSFNGVLTYYDYTVEKTKYIEKFMVNSEERTESFTLGPSKEEVDYGITTNYYSPKNDFTAPNVTFKNDDEQVNCDGVVLMADINLGVIDHSYDLAKNISGNNFTLNYYMDPSAKADDSSNSLFTNMESSIFAKDFSVAGSIVSGDWEDRKTIFADEVKDGSTIQNIRTYGTLCYSAVSGLIQGIAVESGKGTDCKNYASYSFNTSPYFEGHDDKYATTAEETTYEMPDLYVLGEFAQDNYGTFIGANGIHGSRGTDESEAKEGCAGQSIIFAQNDNLANNYGILKAGDGGNGGRGLDGKGGKDTVETTIAPTHGIEGGAGGEFGAGGKIVTISADDERNDFAQKGASSGANGAAGSQGNDGWGGLNLNSYIKKYTQHTKTTYTSKTQFLYYDMFSCATRDDDGEKFGFQGFLDVDYHINRIHLEGNEVTFYFDCDQPFTDGDVFEEDCLESDGIVFSHNTFRFNVWSIALFGGYCMTQQFNAGTEFKFYCIRGFTTSNCYNYTSSNI